MKPYPITVSGNAHRTACLKNRHTARPPTIIANTLTQRPLNSLGEC
ncbi:hypothetical protein M2366_001500 [Aeromonas sp. BIGb0405]|jgi:hypothetical protein|nr:hypothetical protein [Aeromonas sp. BIGb0405]